MGEGRGGGGRGRMEDLMKDLQGEWREDQSLPKKYKSGTIKNWLLIFCQWGDGEGGGGGKGEIIRIF